MYSNVVNVVKMTLDLVLFNVVIIAHIWVRLNCCLTDLDYMISADLNIQLALSERIV